MKLYVFMEVITFSIHLIVVDAIKTKKTKGLKIIHMKNNKKYNFFSV